MALESPPSRSRVRTFVEDYGLLVVAGTFLLLAVAGGILFLFGDQEFARSLIQEYGLLTLGSIFVLEGAMLMYFAPSELLVPWGMEALAAAPNGEYDLGVISVILAAAVVGATVGQTALFLLAQRGGREWLLEKPWFRIDEAKLDRFDRWFLRWGRPAIPISNALLFTRGMLTVPAGLSEMRVREFAVLSALGTLVFEAWIALAWYLFGDVGLEAMQALVDHLL